MEVFIYQELWRFRVGSLLGLPMTSLVHIIIVDGLLCPWNLFCGSLMEKVPSARVTV